MADPLIEQTIKVWQPLSPTPLTAEDAAEIISSFAGFLSILRRWQVLAEGEAVDQPDPANPIAGHFDQPGASSEETA